MNARMPAEVFPPGEFLREELEAREWSQQELADILDRPARLVSELISGKRAITLTGKKPAWFEQTDTHRMALCEFDAVVMRKDPPFDAEYIYATHLLTQAEREGARVFNAPQALREHPEKLAILEFAQHIAPTLVTRSAQDIRAFHAEHQDIILKPLDGMGGSQIFRVRKDDPNRNVILETLTEYGMRTIMAQRYLAQIAEGDKRVLIIGGKQMSPQRITVAFTRLGRMIVKTWRWKS